jgi:cytochrome P450
MVMRIAVNQVWDKLGSRRMSPNEICENLLTTIAAVSGNLIILATQVIKELSYQPVLWSQLREELDGAGVEGILQNKTLEACILEGARVNSNALTLRRSLFPSSTLGDYDVGDCDQLLSPEHI